MVAAGTRSIRKITYLPRRVRNSPIQLAEWKGSKGAKPVDVQDLAAAHAEGWSVTRRGRIEDRIKEPVGGAK